MNFEKKIGYVFKNKKHLEHIIIHPSYKESEFQIYEFLGDRIIGIIAAEICFKYQKKLRPMANMFVNMVSSAALSKIAIKWEIDKYLKHNIENLSEKLYADVVEAIVAGIYLDSDYEKTFNLMYHLLRSSLESLNEEDVKMLLQEYSQKKGLGLPLYTIINEFGKDHDKIFTIKVEIPLIGSEIGHGKSKQEASKNAAKLLLDKFNYNC